MFSVYPRFHYLYQGGYNNNNNNTQDDIYSVVIMTTRSLREFTQFIWWM